MVWQDVVIAFVNLSFSYSLVLQVVYGFSRRRKNIVLSTAFITSFGLYVLSFAFFTLNLVFSSVIAMFNASMWSLLFMQSLIYKE